MAVGISAPDPFVLADPIAAVGFANAVIMRQTSGLTVRNQAFNPAQKNLVLIGGLSQSNLMNVNPTLFVPAHSSVIDNFNVYDGASYNISGPLLGTTIGSSAGTGPGNMLARVAELFVANAVFDRVIIVPIAIGGSSVADWATGIMTDRIPATLRRLASRGYTVGATGLTFAVVSVIGETDCFLGTSQASYTASINTVVSNLTAAGFYASGTSRLFINRQTWQGAVISVPIQSAQVALPNGTTMFAGGDLDTLDGTNRFDNTHFNDVGAANAANLMYNAMHASGAPF